MLQLAGGNLVGLDHEQADAPGACGDDRRGRR
jgi:hypothetical protein